jgi:hypothetical protein
VKTHNLYRNILAAQPKDPNGFNKLPNGVTEFVITNPIGFPTVDAWNFTIQRQLGKTMSAENRLCRH